MLGFISGLFAAFVFGTWLFWLGALVLFGFMVFFLDSEDGFKSTVVFVVSMMYLQFAAQIQVFQLIAQHPIYTLGGYLLGGVVYGLWRWWWHCRKFRGRYELAKAAYAHENHLDSTFDTRSVNANDWKRALERAKASKLPVALQSKALITMWMMYWPWSLFWTVFRDFIVELWSHIYTFLSKTLQRIADRALGKDIQNDFSA